MALKVRFLDLSVGSRNRATTLLSEIKAKLRKDYSLRSLGLNAHGWHNVDLSEFMRQPKEHYIRVINGESRNRVSKQDLIKEINHLYALFSAKKRPRGVGG